MTGAVIPAGRLVVGLKLPIHGGGARNAEEWEPAARQRTLEGIVRKADASGFFYLGVDDHIAIPTEASGELGSVWYDVVATLAWVAALTQRTRVLAKDFVIGYRHPLAAAKALMTLDTLSQGRLIACLAAGDLEPEFDVLGIPFVEREALLDSGLAILRDVFESEHLTVSTARGATSVGLAPRPAQAEVPIWISGSSDAAIQRAAQRADGWCPSNVQREAFASQVSLLAAARSAAGRDARMDVGAVAEPMYVGRPSWPLNPGDLFGDGDHLAARIAEFGAMGANHVLISLRSRTSAELLDQLEAFGSEVIPRLDPHGQRSARYDEPPFEEIARLSRLQVQAMEANPDDEGVWGSDIGNEMLLLTTRGRRTGLEHKVALACWRDTDGYPILVASYAGSPKHPDWYLNLADRRANPRVRIRTGGRTYEAEAQELAGAEYQEIWSQLTLDRPSYRNYSGRTERRFALVRLLEV